MGLEDEWCFLGSATYKEDGYLGHEEGQGDSTGGPRQARNGLNDCPTLVVEAGYSLSLEALQSKMRWWFATSKHEVKIVLLAKFNNNSTPPSIILEKWVEEEAPPRPGATTTRAAAASRFQPARQQIITITRDPTTNPASYHVTGGALVLEFPLLFLRPPQDQERDIVIGIPALEVYADLVWNRVPV